MKEVEYIILTLSKYNESQLETISSQCISPIITARQNSDNTKCLVKVNVTKIPQYCDALTRYSKSEIAEVVKGSEWQLIQEIPEE